MNILRYAAWAFMNVLAVIGGIFIGVFGGFIVWGFFH